jgi:hypothetical protein
MQRFLYKKGGGEKIEKGFRGYIYRRIFAKAQKTNFMTPLSRSLFNSTYFIRLHAKKRRRYTKYKIQPVEKKWARHKALSAFAKSFKEARTSSKDFFSALEKVLELLQSGKSNIQVNRDEYHRTAYKAMPQR